MAGGRKRSRKCCNRRGLAIDARPEVIIYGPDGRGGSGKKTENETSHLICADEKPKTKGKEEFLAKPRSMCCVHEVRGFALNAGCSIGTEE